MKIRLLIITTMFFLFSCSMNERSAEFYESFMIKNGDTVKINKTQMSISFAGTIGGENDLGGTIYGCIVNVDNNGKIDQKNIMKGESIISDNLEITVEEVAIRDSCKLKITVK